MDRRLGEQLVADGVISQEQLQQGLRLVSQLGGRIGTSLIEVGALDEDQLLEALGKHRGTRTATRQQLENIPASVIRLLPAKLAKRYQLVPYELQGKTLLIASADVMDGITEDEIRMLTGHMVRTAVALDLRLKLALQRYYRVRFEVRYSSLAKRMENGTLLRARTQPATSVAPAPAVEPEEEPKKPTFARLEPPPPVPELPKLAPEAKTEEPHGPPSFARRTPPPPIPPLPSQVPPEPPKPLPPGAPNASPLRTLEPISALIPLPELDENGRPKLPQIQSKSKERPLFIELDDDDAELLRSMRDGSGSDAAASDGKEAPVAPPAEPATSEPATAAPPATAPAVAPPAVAPPAVAPSAAVPPAAAAPPEPAPAAPSESAAPPEPPEPPEPPATQQAEVTDGGPPPAVERPLPFWQRPSEIATHAETVSKVETAPEGAVPKDASPEGATPEVAVPESAAAKVDPPQGPETSPPSVEVWDPSGGAEVVEWSTPAGDVADEEIYFQEPSLDDPELTMEERLDLASAMLQDADIRDEIGDVLLRFAAPYFERRLLFFRRKERIVGWRGEGEGVKGPAVRAVEIGKLEPSVFLSVTDASSLWLGPLPPLEPNQRLLAALGGAPPKDCLVLPVVLRSKIVCYFYGDNRQEGISGVPMEDIRRLLAKASIAFEVYILKNKMRLI